MAKTLVATKAGVAHLADKLDGLPLAEGKAVPLTEESVVEVRPYPRGKAAMRHAEWINVSDASMLSGRRRS